MCIAVPARVDCREGEGRILKVDTLGFRYAVCGELVPTVVEGDWVLVHMGFALAVVDREAAELQLRLMEKIAGGALASGQ